MASCPDLEGRLCPERGVLFYQSLLLRTAGIRTDLETSADHVTKTTEQEQNEINLYYVHTETTTSLK